MLLLGSKRNESQQRFEQIKDAMRPAFAFLGLFLTCITGSASAGYLRSRARFRAAWAAPFTTYRGFAPRTKYITAAYAAPYTAYSLPYAATPTYFAASPVARYRLVSAAPSAYATLPTAKYFSPFSKYGTAYVDPTFYAAPSAYAATSSDLALPAYSIPAAYPSAASSAYGAYAPSIATTDAASAWSAYASAATPLTFC